MMKFLVALVVVFSFLPAHAEGDTPEIVLRIHATAPETSFPWPSNGQKTATITKSQVKSLLNAVMQQNPGSAGESVDVDQFQFASLDEGRPFLVAVTDSSPMKSFQEITVLRCVDQTCQGVILRSEPPIDLNRQIVAVQSGEARKLLIGTCVCPDGEREPGHLKHLFGVTDDQLEDQSTKFPEYFRANVVPKLNADLDAVQRSAEPDSDLKVAELTFAKLELERRVFGERTAGSAAVQAWLQSPSPKIQRLGVQTLEQIGDTESEQRLNELATTGANDRKVAAREALARLRAKQQSQKN